jgi:CRISPR/Cas system-associated exonuclease Cas4 (RecB family)
MEKKSGFKKGKISRKEVEGYWEGIIEQGLKTESLGSRNRVFASSVALCERQTAGLLMLPDTFKIKRQASTQFYFKVGSLYESIMAEGFQRNRVFVTDELRVEIQHPELTVSGRIDFVLKDEDEQPIIMELKSCGKLPTSPKPHHLAQLHAYMIITGQSKALLWYVSRSISDFSGVLKQKVFEVKLTEDQKRTIATRIALGCLYSDSDYIPPKPEHMKKWRCGFCPLIPMCWNGVDLIPDFYDPDEEDHLGFVKQAEVIAEEMIEAQKEYKLYFEYLLDIAVRPD